MGEGILCTRSDRAFALQNSQVRIPGDSSKGQDYFRPHDFQFALEVSAAVLQFVRCRLVVWRSAPSCRSDVGVLQSQLVIPMRASRLIRKSRLVQLGIQEVA